MHKCIMFFLITGESKGFSFSLFSDYEHCLLLPCSLVVFFVLNIQFHQQRLTFNVLLLISFKNIGFDLFLNMIDRRCTVCFWNAYKK